ncbi:hypothetical protein VNO77_31656 [Canavalia gladiata]|uniref:Uncharacterized protein n=1 Tax=Canavalia gladiata TaxID=3824 RepID=A0AAN9Q4P2_CANGL
MRVSFGRRGNQFMRVVCSDSMHSIFGHSLVKLMRLRHDMGYSPLNHSFECKFLSLATGGNTNKGPLYDSQTVCTRVDLHKIVCTHTRLKETWTMTAVAYVHASIYLKISLRTHNPSGHQEPNASLHTATLQGIQCTS